MNQRTARFAVPTILALGLALAGCSTDADTPSTNASAPAVETTAATFNDVDVAFARGMVPHHAQAVGMSETILAKDGIDPRVSELAEAIAAAQQPEIDQLNGMLLAWGQPPADSDAVHGGMGGMGGMMSDEDMMSLDEATGADASRLFLRQMIMHHEGAVIMAEQEIASGRYPEAVALAEDIVAAQSEEIALMREILESL